MKESFAITPRIIAHLGEDLIKNESIALLELVKNSYDAFATECAIDFNADNTGLVSITITDNGQGMNVDIIRNVWLVIGTDFKYKKLEDSSLSRLPLGEKGIGRLGVHKLGNTITLISKTEKDKEIVLKIDWTTLESANKINDFTIDLQENDLSECFQGNETGTKIIIKNLKTSWDKKQLKEVYRNLTSLNSPFSNNSDSFNVKITSNSDLFQGLPSFDDIKTSGMYFGHCVMNGDSIKDFKYEFKPWETLSKIDCGRTVLTKDLTEEDIKIKGIINEEDTKRTRNNLKYIDLIEYGIGEIEFDVIIYETDTPIFGFVNAEKSAVKLYLRENGGVRVYRDNVRVYDYGERDDDWLGIDLKRVGRVGGNVSKNIILGSVKIKRSESYGLREKTNREGFIEDASYKAFVEAVNYILAIFVRERNNDKSVLTTLYKKDKSIEPVLADLNEAIEIVEERVIEEETKNDILKCLYRINNQYKQVKEVLVKCANAGLNLGIAIHEIEKQIAALIGCAKRGENERVIKISDNLEKIVRGFSAMIRKSDVKEYCLSSIIKIALDNYEFRFSDHKIEIIDNFGKTDLRGFTAKAEAISVLTNLLDNSIYWLSYARKENRKISIFTTDEIKGYNSIVVSDNGPGFNIPIDVAVQPFITGKPHSIGMGLGLHIADIMMREMKGELRFLDKSDVNLPKEAIEQKADKAVLALCFPKIKIGEEK